MDVNIGNIFRWIILLPLSILASWLTWIVLNFMNHSMGGLPIIGDAISHAGMGAAFVYAGAYLAPAQKEVTGFCLGGIAIIGAGFLLYPALAAGNFSAIIGGISMAVGAGTMTWCLRSGALELYYPCLKFNSILNPIAPSKSEAPSTLPYSRPHATCFHKFTP